MHQWMYVSLCIYVLEFHIQCHIWGVCQCSGPCLAFCLFYKVCICLCLYMCPGQGWGHTDCTPGLWMHHRPPIITFTKSSPNVYFNLEATGQQTIRITGKKSFQWEWKTNLETDKWSSLFSEMAFMTTASLQSYVIIFGLRCRCPPWPRIYSALITDCGCMLINVIVPKDKNRQGSDVRAWQSSMVTYSLGDDPWWAKRWVDVSLCKAAD